MWTRPFENIAGCVALMRPTPDESYGQLPVRPKQHDHRHSRERLIHLARHPRKIRPGKRRAATPTSWRSRSAFAKFDHGEQETGGIAGVEAGSLENLELTLVALCADLVIRILKDNVNRRRIVQQTCCRLCFGTCRCEEIGRRTRCIQRTIALVPQRFK